MISETYITVIKRANMEWASPKGSSKCGNHPWKSPMEIPRGNPPWKSPMEIPLLSD